MKNIYPKNDIHSNVVNVELEEVANLFDSIFWTYELTLEDFEAEAADMSA